VRFSPDDQWLRKLLEFTQVLGKSGGGQYQVAPTLMRGPLDLLSQVVGDERMCYEMIDRPAKTKAALEVLTELWIQVAQAQLAAIPQLNGGHCNGYGVWAPGTTLTTQEDHSIMLSPRQYEEYLLPCNERMASQFDYLVMHLHSGSLRDTLGRLEALLNVEQLGAVQVTRDIVSPPLARLIEIYALIQERKPVIIWGAFTRDELEEIARSISSRGVCIRARIETWVEYERVRKWLGSMGWGS
jgi:hypothetical protein